MVKTLGYSSREIVNRPVSGLLSFLTQVGRLCLVYQRIRHGDMVLHGQFARKCTLEVIVHASAVTDCPFS